MHCAHAISHPPLDSSPINRESSPLSLITCTHVTCTHSMHTHSSMMQKPRRTSVALPVPVTTVLKLNNNYLKTVVGLDVVLPQLLDAPFNLTMLDLSFNEVSESTHLHTRLEKGVVSFISLIKIHTHRHTHTHTHTHTIHLYLHRLNPSTTCYFSFRTCPCSTSTATKSTVPFRQLTSWPIYRGFAVLHFTATPLSKRKTIGSMPSAFSRRSRLWTLPP